MTFVAFWCGFMIGACFYAWKHNRDLEDVRNKFEQKLITAIRDTKAHAELCKHQAELNKRAEDALDQQDKIVERVLGKVRA
tara:strand:- start:21276 stop:21518 length:243 start_codon:yes stop_codon:yes gene_type:complete